MENKRKELGLIFSKGIIFGLGFILVLGLSAISYAAFTIFTDLEATNNETLTLTKWNNLVDAVQDDFSLTETRTNMKWMGKPIYRKVVDIYPLPNSSTLTYAHEISDLGIMTSIRFIRQTSAGDWTTMTNLDSAISAAPTFRGLVGSTNISIQTTVNYSSSPNSYAILEYTKTTD